MGSHQGGGPFALSLPGLVSAEQVKICLPAAGDNMPAEHKQHSQNTDGLGRGPRDLTRNKTGARQRDHPTSTSVTSCAPFAVTPVAS